MQDEHQHPLQAAQYSEDICHGQCALIKLKAAKHPHDAKDTQLSDGSDGKCSVGGDRDF